MCACGNKSEDLARNTLLRSSEHHGKVYNSLRWMPTWPFWPNKLELQSILNKAFRLIYECFFNPPFSLMNTIKIFKNSNASERRLKTLWCARMWNNVSEIAALNCVKDFWCCQSQQQSRVVCERLWYVMYRHFC